MEYIGIDDRSMAVHIQVGIAFADKEYPARAAFGIVIKALDEFSDQSREAWRTAIARTQMMRCRSWRLLSRSIRCVSVAMACSKMPALLTFFYGMLQHSGNHVLIVKAQVRLIYPTFQPCMQSHQDTGAVMICGQLHWRMQPPALTILGNWCIRNQHKSQPGVNML